MKNNNKIQNATTIKEYYNGLTKKNRAAWDHIFNNGKTTPPETLAEYIARTGCRTETRKSKNGVDLIKVYFENGKIAEYQKDKINTTTAF